MKKNISPKNKNSLIKLTLLLLVVFLICDIIIASLSVLKLLIGLGLLIIAAITIKQLVKGKLSQSTPIKTINDSSAEQTTVPHTLSIKPNLKKLERSKSS